MMAYGSKRAELEPIEQREQWELAQALSSRDRGRPLVKALGKVDVLFVLFLRQEKDNYPTGQCPA